MGGRQRGTHPIPIHHADQASGDLTITAPGVYDGLDISGYVVIKAPNVTLRRCIVRGGQPITKGGNAVMSIVQGGGGIPRRGRDDYTRVSQ